MHLLLHWILKFVKVPVQFVIFHQKVHSYEERGKYMLHLFALTLSEWRWPSGYRTRQLYDDNEGTSVRIPVKDSPQLHCLFLCLLVCDELVPCERGHRNHSFLIIFTFTYKLC